MAAPAQVARARTEPRLDPVRWRRPGRGTLIRLVAVAALLGAAALIAWSGAPTCASPPTGRSAPEPSVPGQASPGRPASNPAAGAPAAPNDRAPSGQAASGRAGSGSGDIPAGTRPAVPAGTVGVPVRLAEPTALVLVHPGDRVDLFRVDEAGDGATPVAAAAVVLDVTGADDLTPGGVLLALPRADAEKAVAAQGHGFAILIRPA